MFRFFIAVSFSSIYAGQFFFFFLMIWSIPCFNYNAPHFSFLLQKFSLNFQSYRIHSNRASHNKCEWFYWFFFFFFGKQLYSRNRFIKLHWGKYMECLSEIWSDILLGISVEFCFAESALLTIPLYRPMKWSIDWSIDRSDQIRNRWGDQIRVWLLVKDFFFCLFATFFVLPVNIGFMRYFSKRFHHLPKLEIKFYWINFTYATYISSILFYGSVAAIYSSIAKCFYSRWILVIKEVFNYLQQKKSFTGGNVAKFYLGSMGKLVNAVMIGIR